MNKKSEILFLFLVIINGLFSPLLLFFIYQNPKSKAWIDYPTTKREELKSKNENEYISSFLGSKFSNYSLYKPNNEPNPYDKLSDSTFLGDLENIGNVINDETTLNLWKIDTDYVQFVVYIKQDGIKEITLSIDQPSIGFEIKYGWSTYIYSKGPDFPSQGVWTPDALTEDHTLKTPIKNAVFVAWISIYTTGQQDYNKKHEINLKTSVALNANQVFEQTNKVEINLINQDYSDLIKTNNGFVFLNNDPRLVNHYINAQKPKLPEDLNDEVKYLNFSWDNYLEATYTELLKSHAFDYYSTFFTNAHGKYGHQETTWNFSINDPSLITWHRGKDEKGKYYFYVPEDETKAFFFNLTKVKKVGIKNIFLRAFDGVKWYLKKDNEGRYTSNNPTFIFDDETQALQKLDLALVNRQSLKDVYSWTSFDYVKEMLNWFVDNLNHYSELKELNYYLYFDELIEEEMKEFINQLNYLKQFSMTNKYDFLKICYVNLYREIHPQADYLNQIELLYIHNTNFYNITKSKIFQNFINKREKNNLKTSQYNLLDSYASRPGHDYANHAFWMNFVGYIRNAGFLTYTLNSWNKDSWWTDQFAGIESGELMYIYPSPRPKEYLSKSVRLEMLIFGYNMYLKYLVLLSEFPEKVEKYFLNYDYLKNNNVDFQFSRGFRYNFNQKLTERTLKTQKSPFLNWIINTFKKSGSITEKMLINYATVNLIEGEIWKR